MGHAKDVGVQASKMRLPVTKSKRKWVQWYVINLFKWNKNLPEKRKIQVQNGETAKNVV